MVFFLLFLFIAAPIVILLVYIIKSNNTEAAQSSQIYIENDQAITNWRQKRKDEYNVWIERMKNNYGEIDIIISIVPFDPQKTLLLFKERGKIYFSSSWLKFKNIISCQIIDNPKIESGKTVAITKGDLWNEIKRSSMQRSFGKTTGTWLAGPEKHITEYQKNPDKIYHNYSIIIGTSDISSPLFEIKIGDDVKIAQHIDATINAIIATQQNK